MNEDMKRRLIEAMEIKEVIKLMFIYPNTKPIFNRGKVISVGQDSFEFEDRFIGVMTFGYSYLEGIMSIVEEEGK